MRKVLGIALVLALVAGGAYYLFMPDDDEDDGMALDDNREHPSPVNDGPGPEEPEERIDIDELLLSTRDLPRGYRRTEVPEDEGPMCEASGSLDEVDPDEEEAVAFADGEAEYVVQKVRRYRGRRAEAAFDVVREEINRCSRFTDVEDDGDETVWIGERIELADLGDERFAVRLTPEVEDSRVDALYVRYDDVIVAVAYVATDAGNAHERLAADLLREIDDRVLSS